jgi:hypothetical protein
MTGYPHPKGPEHGKAYATPEEAREAVEAGEDVPVEIPMDRFMESLNSPKVQALLADAAEIELNGPTPEGPCIEIDAEEFEEARRDPAVKDLLRRADEYGAKMKAEGRLENPKDA